MDNSIRKMLCIIMILASFITGWMSSLYFTDYETKVTMSGAKLYYNNDGTNNSEILKQNNNSLQEQEEKIDKVELNTATKEELMYIPSIGEKTVEKIINYRNNTPFKTTEGLLNIKGIGEKTYAKIREYVYVSNEFK